MTADTRIAEKLSDLIDRGEVGGQWPEKMVRAFERECCEFLGEHGDALLAALRSLRDARDTLAASESAQFSATKTLQTELRIANEMVATLRGYLAVVSRERDTLAEALQEASAVVRVYVIAGIVEADAEAPGMGFDDGLFDNEAQTIAKQRWNAAYDRLLALVDDLPHVCLCDTTEEGWRPCPPSLCELPDHPRAALPAMSEGPPAVREEKR